MVLQNALILSDLARDRIAPDFTIRHPVCPIVALQRRLRFSARLAGFCRGRCHQRRARRAELASFSVFVSNLDFRVPRLRPNRRTGADLAVRQRKRGHPRGPESRPRLSRRSRPSTFWSRCNPGLLDVHLSPGMDPGPRPKVWHPVSGRCFPARTGDPESPAATPGRNQRWIDFLRSTGVFLLHPNHVPYPRAGARASRASQPAPPSQLPKA